MHEVILPTGRITFGGLAAGPEDGPLVLCLHGFPEFSRSWRHQLPALADAGYRAVAPDLRGYGATDKRGPYDLVALADDVAALIRALGRGRAVVAGHDWGGAIGWTLAHRHPALLAGLAVLNCPHPAAMARELRNPRQLVRSAYIGLFQLPRIPEWLLTRNRAAAVARAIRGGSHVRDAWPPEELERYREAFLRPGVAEASLGYYRAAARRALRPRRAVRLEPIATPTLVLWGLRDRALVPELAAPERLRPWFTPACEPDVVPIGEAGHFVQNEAPERVNTELLRWLAARSLSPPAPR